MDIHKFIFWIAVALIVVSIFLWFGKELITNMIAVNVQVNP